MLRFKVCPGTPPGLKRVNISLSFKMNPLPMLNLSFYWAIRKEFVSIITYDTRE